MRAMNALPLRLGQAAGAVIERVRSENGQTLAEYGLVVTLIAVGITVLALVAFREVLIASFNAASTCLHDIGDCT